MSAKCIFAHKRKLRRSKGALDESVNERFSRRVTAYTSDVFDWLIGIGKIPPARTGQRGQLEESGFPPWVCLDFVTPWDLTDERVEIRCPPLGLEKSLTTILRRWSKRSIRLCVFFSNRVPIEFDWKRAGNTMSAIGTGKICSYHIW